jgi:hypothetical protein
MDFSAIFQIKNKKFWWMDVIFYLVISLLIASIFCYVIFLVKNNFQKEDIKKEIAALQTVGTEQQKEHEKEVVDYRKKINDFSALFKNHQFASNVFAFMQAQTMPNVWFKQFGLDEKNNGLQLSGESDDMGAFSRQVASFEKNKYIKSIGTLNSSQGQSTRINFNISLVLDQSIFEYLSSVSGASASLQQSLTGQDQTIPAGLMGLVGQTNQTGQTGTPGQTGVTGQTGATGQAAQAGQTGGAPSSEKLITAFHILLNPEVIGIIDETNYTVILNVPYGTDVKNLTSSIVISPEATILPASGVSQDFTSPVNYTVVAQDGSIQNYTVTVAVAAPPEANEKSGQSGSVALIIVTISIVILAVIAAIILFIRRRNKGKK